MRSRTKKDRLRGIHDNPGVAPRSTIYSRLESAFITLLAAGVVFYGNGQHDLVTLAFTDKRMNMLFLFLGIINMFFNGVLFVYVFVWLGYIKGVRDPLGSGTLAVPAGAVTSVTTVVSMIVALWPIFSVLAIVQVMVITYGLVSSLNFVPGWGPLKVSSYSDDKDG